MSSSPKLKTIGFEIPENLHPVAQLGSGITAQIVTLTPELASKFLTRVGKKQRNLRPSYVRRLREDIREGRWCFNGEPIIFDDQDFMIDGRHRCTACIEEDVPLKVLVIRGISHETYASLDCGAVRMGRDALASEGYVCGGFLSTAAVFLYRYENKMLPGMGGFARRSPSPLAVSAIVAQHPDLVEAVRASNVTGKIMHSVGAATFARYILVAIDAPLAEKFFGSLATGEELKRGDPVLAVRNRALSGTKFDSDHAIIFMFKAWNACRRGRTLLAVSWAKGDSFPYPI